MYKIYKIYKKKEIKDYNTTNHIKLNRITSFFYMQRFIYKIT